MQQFSNSMLNSDLHYGTWHFAFKLSSSPEAMCYIYFQRKFGVQKHQSIYIYVYIPNLQKHQSIYIYPISSSSLSPPSVLFQIINLLDHYSIIIDEIPHRPKDS